MQWGFTICGTLSLITYDMRSPFFLCAYAVFSQKNWATGNNTTMMQITEDTPPDMLAGAMDLTIHLPNGRAVKMSVERSTPMMDLLVQITTANQLQHSGHILQALEMAPTSGRTDKVLPYKPNTPIGALDTQHVKVVPKNKPIPAPRHQPVGHQPFESTFRLQVHLPRNQLYVIRVSQHVLLEDIMKKVCSEKNLDSRKYEFRHPGNLDEVLDPKLTLSDYQITEVYIVSKGTVAVTQAFSSNDIMALKKEEERKQLQARTGGGVFSLIFKRGKPSMGSGSLSSDNRSISPSHSDDSRSVTPPAIQQQILPVTQQSSIVEKPKPPQRKRRPAPKPPQQANLRKDSTENPPSQISTTSDMNNSDLQSKNENGLTICHSRNSSDSSGYHEPSVLSDNCNLSLPRRPKSIVINETVSEETTIVENNKSNGNLTKMAVFSKSSTSITNRKKKAAPPPPIILSSSERIVQNPDKASPVVASPISEAQENVEELNSPSGSDITRATPNSIVSIEESPNPDVETNIKNSLSTAPSKESPRESVIQSTSAETSSTTPSLPSTIVKEDKVDSSLIDEKNTVRETKHIPKPNDLEPIIEVKAVPAPSNFNDKALNPLKEDKQNITEEFPELESEWQYQLPSPPTAFRDLSPTNLTEITNYDTITLEGFKEESVITNPMLYEKLELIKDSETDTISDLVSNISEEEKPMLNKLTLENLEKRKSLVYNRELSTSLKVAKDNSVNNKLDDTAIKRSNVIHEIEEVIQQQNGANLLSRHNSCATDLSPTLDKPMPNFKISTYDKPKTKINIFEDDSIRSNVEMGIKANSVSESEAEPEAFLQNVSEMPQNSSYRKQSIDSTASDDSFKKPQEFSKYKLFSKNNFYVKHRSEISNSVTRSESFSSNSTYTNNVNIWKPQNPVQRSKSQVALNNYKEEKIVEHGTDTLSKSNSLFDVSGLQSLEVMRMIQTKLNTPSNSTEQLLKEEKPIENLNILEEKEPICNETNNDNRSVKTYKYQGPPAINLSTWSERPKTKVSLKEDTDYRSNKIKINGVAWVNRNESDANNVSIKVNGVEHMKSQESGNLVIKVGETQSNYTSLTRFSNNTSTVNFRKPLSNINKIDTGTRPHSIAFSNDFDISRVPIVRAVELKKPFKDNVQINQKSITSINSSNNELTHNFRNKFKDLQVNGDSVKEIDGLGQVQNLSDNADADLAKRTVHRVNSFAQSRFGPTVVGFRSAEFGNDNTARSRKSWNVPNNYTTLPPKIDLDPTTKATTYIPNNNVPFSQATLRRVEVNKPSKEEHSTNNQFDNVVLRNNHVGNKVSSLNRYSTGNIFSNESCRKNSIETVVPPPMPKVMNIKKKPIKTFEPVKDPRDDLLNSIRNFGGINGLKNVKV
ncbi:hypothetical protein RN001_008068 [Aquatica leii]|uniref:WH2 domain-containing protein n=1 Tax=Aquatica leii TaxID=1421715 RepID=A0AAN7PYU1_9COLE|nr:hypothetical protein RN001_008068 [Aquatica leii]